MRYWSLDLTFLSWGFSRAEVGALTLWQVGPLRIERFEDPSNYPIDPRRVWFTDNPYVRGGIVMNVRGPTSDRDLARIKKAWESYRAPSK